MLRTLSKQNWPHGFKHILLIIELFLKCARDLTLRVLAQT